MLVADKVLITDKVDGVEGSDELIEKYEKLSKTGKLFRLEKLKSEKMSKSQNSTKSRKKLSKNGNSTNFNATEGGPKFLTSNTRTTFNRLQLAFTEAPIIWHFDPECHI